MATKIIKSFRLSIIRNRLMKKGSKNAMEFLSIIVYLFMDEVQELIHELDSKFNSKRGPKAYPRTLVIGVLMYALKTGKTNLKSISSFCEDSTLINMFTSGFNPKEDVYRRLLKETDPRILKKIFLFSLIRLNDYGWLDLAQLFVDGTDALVNASKYYLIHLEEIENVKKIKKLGLLHNGKKGSPKRFKEKLNKILESKNLDEETEKVLKLALKNSKIYCRKVFNNIDELEKAIEKSNKNYVSISFPDAVMMKTKKGGYEFGLNLQSIMANHQILITGVLLRKPNDHSVLEEVLNELKLSFEILKELNLKYGPQEYNKKFEFENLIDHAIFICDSGYFSKDNFEIADFNGLNLIVMSKQIARQNNNEKRKLSNIQLKNGKNNKMKRNISKKQCIRIVNAYVCPNKKLISLDSITLINGKYNRQKHITGDLREFSFKFSCKDCKDCPFVEKFGKKCKCAQIEDRMSLYMYKMTNAFAEGKYNEIYKDRFFNSECINGFHKTKDSILNLLCRDFTANQNEMHLRGLLYNIIRLKELKGTFC